MKKRSHALLSLSLATMLLLSACGGNSGASPGGSSQGVQASGGAGASGNTLVVAVQTDPGNFNPYEMSTFQAESFYKNALETLFELTSDNEIKPALAAGYEWENDTTLVLNLRQGVKFHNGEVMTVDDVLFSFQTFMDTATGSSALSMVERFEEAGQNSVRVMLKNPDATVLNVFAGRGPYIVSQKAYTEMGSEFALNPIGTGYFMFTGYVAGDSATLTAFDEYWGEHGNIETLILRVISESAQSLIELENGNINHAIIENQADLDICDANPDLDWDGVEMNSIQYVAFNCLNEYTSNPLVRQAIAHAINKDDVIRGALGGLSRPAYSIFASSLWGFDESLRNDRYAHSIDRAKELLAEAGYPGGGFELTILSDTSAMRMLQAQIIQANCDLIGIKVNILSYEGATVTSMIASGEGYDMVLRGIVAYTGEPITDSYIATHPDYAFVGGSVPSHCSEGEEIQRYGNLLSQARATLDDAQRKQLLFEAQQVYMDIIPSYPLIEMLRYFGRSNHLNVEYVSGHPIYRTATI